MATIQQVQPVLMSRDVEASIYFYAKLGFKLIFRDDPDRVRYAGVRRDGIDLHLQLHDAKEWDVPYDRPTYRFVVDDVDQLYAEFCKLGILTDISDLRATPWGTREFHVRDSDRNGLQFYRDLLAQLVMALRRLTDLPVRDCQAVLRDHGGDIVRAVEWMLAQRWFGYPPAVVWARLREELAAGGIGGKVFPGESGHADP